VRAGRADQKQKVGAGCLWGYTQVTLRGFGKTKPAQAHAFLIGSKMTMKKVAIGPRNKDSNHQFRPLLPLACAKPALMSESVNHPTAYGAVFGCMFDRGLIA
jgi:hypothetical protein